MRRPPPTARDRRTGPAGFTIVEVMIAMLVLLVGILGVLKLLDGALAGTSGNNARVAATNLGRELAETTRALDYDELTPALLAGRLQARGLGSSSPWTIARRGVTYTIQERVCTYDDGADQIAASAPDNVCSPLPTAATGDENGDDFRRVSFDISWRDQGRTRSLTHTDLVVNPSGGLGPHITSFSPLTQTITAPVGTATIQYVSDAAASLHWRADNGEDEADATGGPTNWTVNWDIRALDNGTEVLDGTYRVTAQAFDGLGIPGDSKLATVILNRRRPYAPPSLSGGHDTRLSDWVDLEWALNSERDILGYRVFWSGADGLAGSDDDVQVCPAAAAEMLSEKASSCTDLNPAKSGATRYHVVAYDLAPGDNVLPGDPRSLLVAAPGEQPDAPSGALVATTSAGGTPTLTWEAPAAGGVSFYRIYRDGTAFADRQGRTGNASRTWTDDEAGGAGHQYWVTAVDAQYNESDPLGPVTWTP